MKVSELQTRISGSCSRQTMCTWESQTAKVTLQLVESSTATRVGKTTTINAKSQYSVSVWSRACIGDFKTKWGIIIDENLDDQMAAYRKYVDRVEEQVYLLLFPVLEVGK